MLETLHRLSFSNRLQHSFLREGLHFADSETALCLGKPVRE